MSPLRIHLCVSIYSRVTASTRYQPPLQPPKKTRAAKSRERKRRRKLQQSGAGNEETTAQANMTSDDQSMDEDGEADEAEPRTDHEEPVDVEMAEHDN